MTESLPAPLAPALRPAQQHHVLNIVRRAAKTEIMPRFRALTTGDVAAKSRPDDLVTAADTGAEAMITRALQIAFPNALVVGEEAVAGDSTLLDKIADAELAFIVDPIDGTWNFAHDLPMFGVILAVTQFGRPAFGLIYDPVGDDWIIADADGDARLERPSGMGRRLHAAKGKPVEHLSGYIPLHLFDKAMQPQLAATMPEFARVMSLRCSAQEYRMIAQGHVDFLLTEGLNPWDHAAGVLICQQAGAYAALLDGEEYSAARTEGFLLVAPDKETWNRLKKIFSFLLAKAA